jgi:hypothetical protein
MGDSFFRTFLFGKFHYIRVRHDFRTVTICIDLRKLGPKEENLRGVINPDQQDSHRTSGSERIPDLTAPQIQPNQELAQAEENGGHGRAQPDVLPSDLDLRQKFENHGKEQCNY